MRGSRFKASLAFGLIAASFLPWWFSSNVLELIARQSDVLVGRYSVDRFLSYLFLTLTLWLAAYAAWSLRKHYPKEVAFRIITLLLAVFVSTVAVDIIGRFARAPRYVETGVVDRTNWPGTLVGDIVRHRPPNQVYKARYADVPRTARSYPSTPMGYPPVDIILTTDHRGYRNLTQLEQYDILAVGDSMTEGSFVSDEQVWPVLLGRKLIRTVYNLGMGGADPNGYLNAFQAFGLQLKPKTAIFMVYEGNDLRGVERREGFTGLLGERIKENVKYSPVVLGLKNPLFATWVPFMPMRPFPESKICPGYPQLYHLALTRSTILLSPSGWRGYTGFSRHSVNPMTGPARRRSFGRSRRCVAGRGSV